MTPKKIEEMFERFKKANPDPRSDLQFNSPYELLVAVMLSAQATDISVNKATEKLYPVANTPESIIALGVEGLKSYVKMCIRDSHKPGFLAADIEKNART